MEVADDGDLDLCHNLGHRGGSGLVVDGDPNQLAPRLVQGAHLRRRRCHIGGVGVGHRLDDDGMGATHLHAADIHDDGLTALMLWHASI